MPELPTYQGHVPEHVTFSLRGKIRDEGLQPPVALNMGDVAVMVVLVDVQDSNHRMKDGEVTLNQAGRIVEAHLLDPAVAATVLDGARRFTAALVDDDPDALTALKTHGALTITPALAS